MNLKMKSLLVIASMTLFLSSAQAGYGETIYYYCYVGKPPYGNVVYFSQSFGAKYDTHDVGIENAFHSYVAARHDPDASAFGQCMGPYESRSDAENELNDHIAERRRAGKQVVMTWWSYRGD